MNRILIIGSSGFLGSHVVAELARRKFPFETCDRKIIRTPGRLGRSYLLSELDLVPENYDVVMLLSASIPYGRMNEWSQELEDINISLPRKIVRKFSSSRLLYASTVAVYGAPPVSEISEDDFSPDVSYYARSKLEGERLMASAPNSFSLRFSSLYGPGMSAPSFIPSIIKDALTHRVINLHGDGSRLQNYLHVRDAVSMLLCAAESPASGVANAVAARSWSNCEIAERIGAIVGSVTIGFAGPERSPSVRYSNARWNSLFSFRPTISIDEGLRETITYFSARSC